MRKLILVAALATMWTSSCYANLSLASNAPLSPVVAEAKAQATDVGARKVIEPEVRASEARRATVAKSPSRPRRLFSNRIRFIRSFSQHCL
jgi:hypothetical protein